jgi:hypothetical protein
MKWFRCWSDIKDDPKMLGLSDRDFRIWIHLLALVSEEGEGGELPAFSDQGIASSLRTSVTRWRAALITFTSLGMVMNDPLTVTNWSKRQFKSDDVTQRSRHHRATLHDTKRNVAKLHQRQIQKTETDSESSSSPREALSVDALYEAAFKREPTPLESEGLGHLRLGHPDDCLRQAFTSGAARKSPEYAYRILESCAAEGHLPRPRKESAHGNRHGRARTEPDKFAAFDQFEPAATPGGHAGDGAH